MSRKGCCSSHPSSVPICTLLPAIGSSQFLQTLPAVDKRATRPEELAAHPIRRLSLSALFSPPLAHRSFSKHCRQWTSGPRARKSLYFFFFFAGTFHCEIFLDNSCLVKFLFGGAPQILTNHFPSPKATATATATAAAPWPAKQRKARNIRAAR